MGSRGRLLVDLALNISSTTNVAQTEEKEQEEENVPTITLLENVEYNMEIESYATVYSQSVIPGPSVENLTASNDETLDEEPFQDSGSEYLPSEGVYEEKQQNFSTVDTSAEENSPQQQAGDERFTDGRKRSRKSKGQGDSLNWKRAKNSKARLMGQNYLGFTKDASGKYKQTSEKEARAMGPKCEGHQRTLTRGPKQKFECALISEDERKVIFNEFWSINSWEAKKIYVAALVSYCRPKCRRKSTAPEESRKQVGFQYNLNVTAGTEKIKRRVCKKMFLSTIGIKEKTVKYWRLETNTSNKEGDEEEAQIPIQECSKNVREFLEGLPKVESHYCRASSKKLYLEPVWRSYRHLHREFIENCTINGKRPSSWRTFLKTFKSMNLEIYTPKKDQCNSCMMYKNGNLDASVYNKHIKRKDDACAEKFKDKESTDENVRVYTVDLQAVLLCPRLEASAMYYKTKLKVHNLTFYDMKNRDVTCYVWYESSGGLESDVFTSIMVKFFKNEIQVHKPSRIILWSDGCCYQNRNIKLSNGLLELAVAKNVVIEQKYLEVGHTQMEVDSIHSNIERQLRRGREVYLPADYINIIKSARKNPSPYKVVQLTYQDFYSYDGGAYSSIRPGSKKGDPCVTDICALQYTTEGIVNYKLNFNESWEEIPRRSTRTSSTASITHPPLYLSPRPIKLSKFRHLQELKSLMSADYHEFYNNLKHNDCDSRKCTHIINVMTNHIQENDK